MRIKATGQWTLEELRGVLEQAVDRLGGLGVGQVTGVNLYLTLLDDDGRAVVLVDEDGAEFEGFRLVRPVRTERLPAAANVVPLRVAGGGR